MLPFFLEPVRDLRELADRLRAQGCTDEPVLGLWREVACCGVLFTTGKHDVALARLRVMFRTATGFGLLPPPSRGLGATEAHTVATALFAWCRNVFDRRAAA
ncbi:MAG TPA: hypothetical protein VGE74_23995 [Gemmata sp.]